MAFKTLALLFMIFPWHLIAQQDTIALKEVVISDRQLRMFSDTKPVLKLNDSVIDHNKPLLTSLLQYNSPIYFKENGYGMVSSPSFRGTTAQQTAVVWNGININSQFTGQTDFNTINTSDYTSISVRPGGGSAIYGSSAIGGSIHLDNEARFGNYFINEALLKYGSFDTFSGSYNASAGNEKAALSAGVGYNSSKNDYEYTGTRKKQLNTNGQFHNTSMYSVFGYRLGKRHQIKLYSEMFDGERHFSGIISAPGKSKYQDFNTRNLLEISGDYGNVNSNIKVAYLTERYHYFENEAKDFFSGSEAKTAIAKYDLLYRIKKNVSINFIADVINTAAKGTDIDNHKRTTASGSILLSHRFRRAGYEICIRKETGDDYQSPLLFSIGGKYEPFKFYQVTANVSRNYRHPTFNDLYWNGFGNPDLKAERSYQAEVGQKITVAGISLAVTGYYISIDDLIQWHPVNGQFAPENVASANTYGAEAALNFQRAIGRHHISVNSTFAYTRSENDQTKRQLIYVPYRKATASVGYGYRNLSFFWQYLYNGPVFTLSDHTDFLDGYRISNAGLDLGLGKNEICTIGFHGYNIFNETYQSVAKRPMPGRNYLINLKFKI